MHDAPGNPDLLFRYPAVDLREMPHDLERGLEELLLDLLLPESADPATRRAQALIELMSDEHAHHRADRPANGETQDSANGLANPLH